MPKEFAKGKAVPKKTKTVAEKAKPKFEKAKTVPKKTKTVSEKAKLEFKKAKAAPKKDKTVPKQAKPIPKKAKITFCSNQHQAVEEISFGGLLHLKLKTLNRQMLPWLVKHFNGGSCIFTIATGWRSDYGLSDKQALHLSKLESRMVDLVDGGEEFKRCFFLHAMSSFLAPNTNRTVSLKLLKAIEEVDEIKNFDWCSYVLKKLKKVVEKYKNDEKAQNPVIKQTVVEQPRTLGYDHGASTSGRIGHILAFDLPEGVMTVLMMKLKKFQLMPAKEVVNEGGNSGNGAGPSTKVVPGHIIRSNKSQCSLDYGPVGVDVFFVTLFLKANARIFKSMPQLHLEILDYCLLKDDSLQRNENLVTFGDISSAVKDLHDLREGWLCYENPECDIMDAELIYYHVLYDNHYILFVIDHTKEVVYYLDNIIWRESKLAKFNEKKKDPSYVQEIEARRKAAIAEKNKKENKDRKMVEATAKEEADEEHPKGKRTKKQIKKYTPSKQ
uniref:Ubiquitin-like protease family profile domain-containing protein n=1 Tax=Chenopodium quinoa TaxID=63459 RepID=A0A803MP73_CHEQI